MKRALAFAIALGCAGCTRGVNIERVTFGGLEQGHRHVVADLDTDLRDLEYFIRFDYATGENESDPPDAMMNGVEYFGRFYGSEALQRSLSERRGGAVSEGPSRVRIYLPWPDVREGRFLFLRLNGVRPYSCFRIESNLVGAEMPER